MLLWCVAMSLYWRSVHIVGNFRIYLYIRSLVVSQSRMYGSLTHIPLIMQNVTCISLNTGLDHCLVTWRQEIMARTNAEYQSLTTVHFYGNILKSSYLQKVSRFFIWHICIHILVDYELTRVYESLFTFIIYIYIRISPYIIFTIISHFGLQYLVLEHTLVTFMFELPINYKWVFTHWGRVTHKCVNKVTIIGSEKACRLTGTKPLSEPMLEYC